MLREYEKMARQCAREEVDHVGFLLGLAEAELIERDQRATQRRIKAARFPMIKSLENFDFRAITSMNEMLTLDPARCDYITKR